MKRVQRIERLPGGGLQLQLSDGSVIRYASLADLPGGVAAQLSRMDAADGPEGASGGSGGASGGPGDLSAVDRYRQRLQNAYMGQSVGRDPYAGLSGVDRYRAEIEGRWSEPPAPKARNNARKHWSGA
ncbi:MAG: hypothetical protein VKI42_06715 [Synechococcaceae cyanobacterium]|nr:hypothetical protein [Synechococcaceae cyanobacterium]